MNRTVNAAYTDEGRFSFPDYIERVTSGTGGESFLIFGGTKTALYDCGMAYAQEGLIANIEEKFEKHGYETLDCVLLSHTHYDHIGALPYILERWPDAEVCGAEKALKVFSSRGAAETMVRLGEAAKERYAVSEEERKCVIKADGLRCDIVMHDGDSVDLGAMTVRAYETKGHTDCSLSYMLEPVMTLFASESTGVLRADGKMYTAILKDYFQTVESAEKCKALKPALIIGNHFGRIPDEITERYFDLYIEAAEEERRFILNMREKGMSFEEMIKGYESVYWTEERAKSQPKEAFYENAGWIIKNMK